MNEAELLRRLQRLEQKLDAILKQGKGTPQTVFVETLHMYEPKVEQLTFQLEQLDIKELSGALNLGNNFGTVPSDRSRQERSVQAKRGDSVSQPSDSEVKHEDQTNGRWERTGPGVCYRWKE